MFMCVHLSRCACDVYVCVHRTVSDFFDSDRFCLEISCLGVETFRKYTSDDLKAYGELKSSASKYRFQIDGEGGEYESLVVAGPHMRGRLLLDFETHWNGSRGHLSVKQVRTQG